MSELVWKSTPLGHVAHFGVHRLTVARADVGYRWAVWEPGSTVPWASGEAGGLGAAKDAAEEAAAGIPW